MALRLFLLVALLLFCTLQVSSDSEITDQVKPLTYADCQGLCQVRCGLHSRKNVCMRACGTCCARCNCVPPGTYGNREACGKCYTDMTTHGNRLKCP
nr:PREDICTED: snakin-2-like [Daucus carota subsp. sativus]